MNPKSIPNPGKLRSGPRRAMVTIMKKWCLLSLILSAASAGANTSALDSLERISAAFGDKVLSGIVELTGTDGQPQPEDWWLLSYDPESPFKLHRYWADSTRATDEGADDSIYLKGAPSGFLRFDKVKLDSTDTFRRANEEALKVGINFDRIDYRLHCREFSDDPIWTVRLSHRGFFVGKLDFSGSDGSLLRSVWVEYSGRGPRGSVRVTDSAFPGAAPPLVAGNLLPPTFEDPTRPDPQPDPEPTVPDPSRPLVDPTPLPPDPPVPGEHPSAIPVEGRPGYVRSPFEPDSGLVDVRGLDPGTAAHCPYSGKIFRVP